MDKNSTFLLREKIRKYGDTDILIKTEEKKRIIKKFENKGFVYIRDSNYIISLKTLFPNYEHIDLWYNGITSTKITYLKENFFFNNKTKKKIIKLIGLLIHLIINKKFRHSGWKIFHSEFKKLNKKELEFFENSLKTEFKKNYRNILIFINKKDTNKINFFILRFLLFLEKTSFKNRISYFLTLVKNQIFLFKEKRKYIKICFLGVDGSGKTTTINNLYKYLNKNSISIFKEELGVYHNKTFFGKSIGKMYSLINNKNKTNKKNLLKNLNYGYQKKHKLKNFFRILELYFKYFKSIRKMKKNGSKIIIFDRYFYDILFQSKLDFLTKILLKFCPKPDYLFYLQGDPQKIFKRKGERNSEILDSQMKKFEKEIKQFSKYMKINTTNKEIKVLDEVLKTLNNKKFLSAT